MASAKTEQAASQLVEAKKTKKKPAILENQAICGRWDVRDMILCTPLCSG